MESVDTRGFEEDNTEAGDTYENNVSRTFDNNRNVSGTFDNNRNVSGTSDTAPEIPVSRSRSSRGDIDSRASEFSRILSVHGVSGDRSVGVNSRATDFSNIISEADNGKQPWKKKSSSFNSRKTEFSAIQSGYGNNKKSGSFQSKKSSFSAIQSKYGRGRPHTTGSMSIASTKASEFSRIDSKDDNTWRGSVAGRGGASKASEFSRIDSEDNTNNVWQGGTYDESNQNSRPGGTYGNSTNQSGSRHASRKGNLWNPGNESASIASGKSGNISKLTFDGTFGGVQSISRPSTGGSRPSRTPMGNLWNNLSGADGSNRPGSGGSWVGSLFNSGTKNSGKDSSPNSMGNGSQASYGAGKWASKVNDTFLKAGDTYTNGDVSQFTDDNYGADSYAEDAYDDTATIGGTIGTYDGGYSYRSETPDSDKKRRRKSPFKKMFRNRARE